MGIYILRSIRFFLLFFLIVPYIVPVLYAADTEVKRLRFSGNQYFENERLREIIHSRKGDALELRYVKLDKILLRNFYKQHGFLDIVIRDSIVFNRDRSEASIYFNIKEGNRHYLAGFRFKGVQSFRINRLSGLFEIERMEPFNESLITAGTKAIEDMYYNSGKPFVEIEINYLFEADSLVYVLVDIKENQTIYIKDIAYRGLQLVQKFIVRRELEIKEEDLYNRKALEKSQRNIYSLGLFKYVRLEIQPIAEEPNQVILKVMVQEKDPRWVGLRLGLAHEQDAYYGNKVEFTLEGGHRNLFGTGRSVSLHLTPSISYDFGESRIHNSGNQFRFRFVEPWIGNTRTPGIFQVAYIQSRQLNTGDFDLISTSFDVRRQHSEFTELSASLEARWLYPLSDETISEQLLRSQNIANSRVYSLTFYGKMDKRKNLFNPTNSSYVDGTVSFSYSEALDKSIALTNQYITLIGSWQRYQPWRPKVPGFSRAHFTLASRLKSGAIVETGKNKVIPHPDRFYAGGATTVRGYHEQLLGPARVLDDQGRIEAADGGKLLFLSNAEIRIPLFWVVVMEYFVDGGYVWPELAAFRPGDIKFTTGAGLAFLTPLGPVRVDYGHKLMPTDRDPSPGAFHFGLYFAF